MARYFTIVFLVATSSFAFADAYNTATGEYYMDMGGGDKLNTTTGEYIMNMD